MNFSVWQLRVCLLCVLVLVSAPLRAQAPRVEVPRVGIIDYYGLRKVPRDRVQKALAVKEGDAMPGSKADALDRIDEIAGVVGSHIEAVCCDNGKAILFVGIEEKGARHFAFHSPPAGTVQLPSEIVDEYGKFLVALEAAVRRGSVAEDLRSGHSLMADPETRAAQQRFTELAAANLRILRDVLHNSSDDEHRAIAAYLLGYAPKKRDVVDDLQYAMQDPDDGVRNNAMRALGAILVLASRDKDSEIRIPPTWFVEMLNSIVWTDRNKAVMVLLNLTDARQPAVLDLIRERALQSLAEMARWNSLPHAVGAFTLVGRLGGLTEDQIQSAWTTGERESVIAQVLNPKAAKRK
ncbi:MAG: HEAT repeat domain-containing protein [Bryobacteraceae bacterium]